MLSVKDSGRVRPLLLDDEPADVSDMGEVRHWIRVYAGLLELEGQFPLPRPVLLTQRLMTWHERLDFWRGRARQSSDPAIHRRVSHGRLEADTIGERGTGNVDGGS